MPDTIKPPSQAVFGSKLCQYWSDEKIVKYFKLPVQIPE